MTKNVVVIGGGTGASMVLSGLVGHADISLAAVVCMTDDGGSTGMLRDAEGVHPPGDVRQCLVALSPHRNQLRADMNVRTPDGHAKGNQLLAMLEKGHGGNFRDAVRDAERLLETRGQVHPVTLDDVRLCLRLEDGTVIRGEHTITTSFFQQQGRPDLFIDPTPTPNADALAAILAADVVIIGPGNLYSSVIPTLMVPGVPEALRTTRARTLYVCNLVNKPGLTDGFQVHDYVAEIERVVGYGVLNVVIYNNVPPLPEVQRRYVAAGEHPVEFNPAAFEAAHYKAIGCDLVSRQLVTQDPNDPLDCRSLVRHNGALANLLIEEIQR